MNHDEPTNLDIVAGCCVLGLILAILWTLAATL